MPAPAHDHDHDHDHEGSCAICGSTTEHAGSVYGRFSRRTYGLAKCANCGYGFVTNPCRDLATVYDDAYYRGGGADPLVDYDFELDHPDQTVRLYEWRGVARVVDDLVGGITGLRWLDYGCGNGGLVRHLRRHHAVDAYGFEEGAVAARARERGIPVIARSELADAHGGDGYDVVSAIEVLEHTLDPVDVLRTIRRLLRPGGLLFLTTGNARTHAAALAKWSYVIPEIHVSFFEPRTLDQAMRAAGLRPEHRPLGAGFDDILTFKVLKNLRVRRRSAVTDALPRRLLGGVADRVAHLREHPIGWAAGEPSGKPPARG